ncbi:hypothetical protein ACFQ9X_30620 [Catenulispora yoronensis]
MFRDLLDGCLRTLAETLPEVDLADLLAGPRAAAADWRRCSAATPARPTTAPRPWPTPRRCNRHCSPSSTPWPEP